MSLISQILDNDSATFSENTAENIKKVETVLSDEIKDTLNPVDVLDEPKPEAPKNTATIERGDNNIVTDEVIELTEQDRKRNFLYAQLYVLLIDTCMCITAQIVTGDLSEENEKKYSLSKGKQKDISDAWGEVLNLELSRKNPKSALILMFVGAYLPMAIMVLREVLAKKKAAKTKTTVPPLRVVKPEQKAPVADFQKATVVSDTNDLFKEAYSQKEEKPQEQIKMQLVDVDNKKTAQVLRPLEPLKVKDNTGAKVETRGRKKGGKKNPNTNKIEYPDAQGKYSWM